MNPKMEKQRKLLTGFASRRTQRVFLVIAGLAVISTVFFLTFMTIVVCKVGVHRFQHITDFDIVLMACFISIGLIQACLCVRFFVIGQALAAFGLDRPGTYSSLPNTPEQKSLP